MAIGKPSKITLDLYINKHVYTRVAQYDIDSREVIIQITDKGAKFPINSEEYSVRIEYFKNDNTFSLDDIPPENILEDGTIKLVLSEQMCAAYGQCEARLLLIAPTSKEVIHTMHFNVIVDKAVIDNVTATSTDEYKSFENALVRLEYILENFYPITKSQIDDLFD